MGWNLSNWSWLQGPQTLTSVIIEDTLCMFKEFISSQTVRKNFYPPDNNIESDWLVFDFEDPLWVDELLSKLTPDCVYLISCLHLWAVFFFETRVFSVIM